MGLENMLVAGVQPQLGRAPALPPVIEFWPEDVPCRCRPEDELGRAGTPSRWWSVKPEFYQNEAEAIHAWRVMRATPGRLYWAIHLRGRHIKAIHLPGC
jgi:hypothetical protein